ncbi:hypothetical protein DF186_17905, partial [Enterococcus hirae]
SASQNYALQLQASLRYIVFTLNVIIEIWGEAEKRTALLDVCKIGLQSLRGANTALFHPKL